MKSLSPIGYCLIAMLATMTMLSAPANGAVDLPEQYALGKSTQWHVDSADALGSIEDLRRHEAELTWHASNQDTLTYGFSDKQYWFRIELPAIKQGVEPSRYLVIPERLLNTLDVFVVRQDDVIEQFYSGISRPFEQRPIKHSQFIFPLELSHSAPTTVYARVQTNGSMQFEPVLWDRIAHAESSRIASYAAGGFYGIMLVMVLYNFFLFCVVRDRNYLYYIAFVASFTLFMGSLNGQAYQFLWPNSPNWNELAVTLSVALIGVFGLLFSGSFLKLYRHWPLMHRVFYTMLGVSLALTLLSLVLDYQTSIRVNSLYGVVIMLTIFFTGVVMLARGFRHARYFVLAWLALLFGTTVLALSKFGWIPWNPVVANGAQIGAVVEVVLLSFALGDRINQERAARFAAQQQSLVSAERAQQAQQELISAKESANLELERRVAERTHELEKAMAKLETVNKFLEDVSNTDQLTGLNNRHYFVRRYHEEYRRAQRHQAPLCVIMLDIDHFKHFNDTYGHLAGDECLVAVANALAGKVSRAGDTLARFGGEEFIVLLTQTDLEGAVTVAERLRRAVETIELSLEGQNVSVTVSLGVASAVPDDIAQPEQLIQDADEALYQAKEQGRNRVERAKQYND